jgi:bacillithiol biosynthesis deacetylase BshB1
MEKVDILIFAAHPDDAELACGATIAKYVSEGKSVAIVDLTRGELGTRGTPEIREHESLAAAKILGLVARENLELPDGFLSNEPAFKIKVAGAIRKYRPEIIITNAVSDRHPDHGNGCKLVCESVFLANLRKVPIQNADKVYLEPWKPKHVFNYIQDQYVEPDFILDVTGFEYVKFEAIKAYKSQFHDPDSKEPETYISSPEFFDFLSVRMKDVGHKIGVKYAEGFTSVRSIGVKDIFDLI